CVVIFDECRAIAFADISQHTEQMVATKPHRHSLGSYDFLGAAAFRMAAPRADLIRAPARNGVTPKATAFSMPIRPESHSAPIARQTRLASKNEMKARPTRLPFQPRSARYPVMAAIIGNAAK